MTVAAEESFRHRSSCFRRRSRGWISVLAPIAKMISRRAISRGRWTEGGASYTAWRSRNRQEEDKRKFILCKSLVLFGQYVRDGTYIHTAFVNAAVYKRSASIRSGKRSRSRAAICILDSTGGGIIGSCCSMAIR